jgi:hypothetical protein
MFLLLAVSRMVAQPAALREYFSGESANPLRAADSIFYDEAKYRPHLLRLLGDKEFGAPARGLLILFGYPEDVRKIVSMGVFPDEEYEVATALLAPSTEKEWAFLRRAAMSEFGTGRPKTGAIQTLRLLGTARSGRILKESLDEHPSVPSLLGHVSIARSASTVAHSIDAGSLEEIGEPRLNRGGDKALVDFSYRAGSCRYIYMATFHRLGGVWRLRGVREVMQQLLPPGSPSQSCSKSTLAYGRGRD